MARNLFGLVHTLLDDSGALEPGGTVEVYDAGTTTPRTVYSDRALTTTAGSTITADAAGRFPERWVGDTVEVKLIYKDSAGATITTRDYSNYNLSAILAATNTWTATQNMRAITVSADSTYDVGATATRYRVIYADDLSLRPSASRTPAANGDLEIEATNNTTLTFKFKGSDGTIRTGTVTLS